MIAHFTFPTAILLSGSLRIRIRIQCITESSHDITHEFNDFSVCHEIPVYGLYADHNNTVEVSVLYYSGNERISKRIQIQTGPPGLIQAGMMRVRTNRYSDEQKNRLFSIHNAIYDAEGYIRWYTDYQGNKFYTLAGHLIANQIWPDKG
jgi:hypothetical protein